MSSLDVGPSLSEEARTAIEELAREQGRPAAALAAQMLDEAVRMRRVRGIVFEDDTKGRVARIEGSGLGVWEVIGQYRAMGERWARLKKDFTDSPTTSFGRRWLTPQHTPRRSTRRSPKMRSILSRFQPH